MDKEGDSMEALKGLQPERVFYYFEEISRIPRGSGNTDGISSYLMGFAEKHGLWAHRDDANNVIIRKDASAGCEKAAAVILQGHCDMVCEKKPGSRHNFLRDPLKLRVDGDLVYAEDTTLGGDDGIALAYILAILEDDSIVHPALEAVITTDEEIGLLGAAALDYSLLKGRLMLNLDSEEEGILLAGCAGGMTGKTRIPVHYGEVSAEWFEVQICGLTGGHSGSEIDKNRANSNLLAGRLLYCLDQQFEYVLGELEGGTKDNAIPRETALLVGIDGENEDELLAAVRRLDAELKREYRGCDGNVELSVQKKGGGVRPGLNPISLQKVIFYLMNVPNGVIKMSGEIQGLVETSCNLGIMKLQPEEFYCCSSVRSSVGSAKEAVSDRICYLTEFLGGDYEVEGAYPAWEYQEKSPFRDRVAAVCEKLSGRRPEIEVIHAGLECGLFYENLPGLECVSMGPDLRDIHTTEETMSVSSVQRVYELVLEILKEQATAI